MCSPQERQLTQLKLRELDRRDLDSKIREEWAKLVRCEEPMEDLTPEIMAEILIEKFPVKKIKERVYNVTDEEIIKSHEAMF